MSLVDLQFVIAVEVYLHPRMVHHLLEVQPLLRLGDHEASHKISRLDADVLPGWGLEVPLTILDFLKHFDSVLLVEWHCSGEYDEGDDANAPVVALHAVLLFLDDFRRNIAGCPASGARQLFHQCLVAGELTSQAEVCNLE